MNYTHDNEITGGVCFHTKPVKRHPMPETIPKWIEPEPQKEETSIEVGVVVRQIISIFLGLVMVVRFIVSIL
jgi:hypothetical protein